MSEKLYAPGGEGGGEVSEQVVVDANDDAQSLLGNQEVQVRMENAKTRTQPEVGAPVVDFLNVGDLLPVLGEVVDGDFVDFYGSDDWLPVQSPSDEGYILAALTDYAGPAASDVVEGDPPVVEIAEDVSTEVEGDAGALTGQTSAWARVRAGPSVDTEQVVELTEVTTVIILDEAVEGEAAPGFEGTTWMLVELPNGTQGYMHAGLITLNSPTVAGGDAGGEAATGGAANTGGLQGEGGLVTGRTSLRTEASYDAGDPSKYWKANLPGGTNFEILETVAGTDVGGNTSWHHVRITYSSDEALVGQEGYVFSGNVLGVTGPVNLGHTEAELVELLGQSTVSAAKWESGNSFAPDFGGPDFFAPGRYGGQCTWFAQALYGGGGLPGGNAGGQDWANDGRKTGTPAVGKVYVTPGHVAYVKEVSGGNGSWTITLAESNWNSTAEISVGRPVSIQHDAEGMPTTGGWFL